MPTTRVSQPRKAKSKAARGKRKDLVLSIRLDAETVTMLDELAEEMERTRSNVAARAIRQYVEQEYFREGDRDRAAGRTVSLFETRSWLADRAAGRVREPHYGQ